MVATRNIPMAFWTLILCLLTAVKGWCDNDYDNCINEVYTYYLWSQWWFWLIWVGVLIAIVTAVVCCCYRRRVYSGTIMTSMPGTTNVTSVTVAAPPPPPYSRAEYDHPTGYWHPPPGATNPAYPRPM